MTTKEDVAKGLRCAACTSEFMDGHGQPVFCWRCYKEGKEGRAMVTQYGDLPCGWFELKER